MAVYANENGNIKELTSKTDYGNGFVINGIEYLGEYIISDTPTASIPKSISAYKYLIFITYAHTNTNTSEDNSRVSVLNINKCLRTGNVIDKIQLSLIDYGTGKYSQGGIEATDLTATSISFYYSNNAWSEVSTQIFGIY